MLIAVSSFQDRDGLAFLHGLPLGHLDLVHDARPRGLAEDLYLHGLQHDDRVSAADPIPPAWSES